MFDEMLRRETLAPLVLRLALAAIFIYHGLDKVAGKDNEWGALWATNLWFQQARPPQEVTAKLDRLVKEEEDESKKKEIQGAKDILSTAYADENRTAPGSLQIVAVQMAVAWAELLCGIALLVGLLTRVSAVAMIVIQVGAIATVTWARGFSASGAAGYEYNLVVIAACLALLLVGGGALSVDQWLKARRARRAAKAQVPAPGEAAPVGV